MSKQHIEQEHNIDINSSIEDGTYYAKAMDWYFFKFCRPISDRVYAFIIMLLYLIAVYMLYIQIKSWFPLTVNRPIVLVNKDAQFKQVVAKMENPYKNADLALLTFLLKNYVNIREEYIEGSLDLLKIDNRLRKVTNNSTREIAKEFQGSFDASDAKNPIKRLGKAGSRKINILSVDLDIKEQTLFEKITRINKIIELPRSAVIRYEAKELSSRREKEEVWEAEISFNYAGVIINKESKEMILTDFTVTNYKNKKIR